MDLGVSSARYLPAVSFLGEQEGDVGGRSSTRVRAGVFTLLLLAATLPFQAFAGATTGIALRSSTHASNSIGTSLKVNRPSGVVSGDVMVAALYVRLCDSVTAPSGWHLLRHAWREWVYWKLAGSSEASSYTWTFPAAHLATGTILAYTGVDASSPVITSSGRTNSTSKSMTATSISTSQQAPKLVGVFGMGLKTSVTPPDYFTERVETKADVGIRHMTLEVSDRTRTMTGPTGNKIANATVAGWSGGVLLALRPKPVSSSTGGSTGGSTGSGGTTNIYRAFSGASYWNAPIASSAPTDPNSAAILSFLANDNTYPYVRLPGAWMGGGHPIYWATDATPDVPLTCTLYCAKATPTTVRIPPGAKPASSSDGVLVLYDVSRGYVLGLWKASQNANGSWTAQGSDIYWLNSNGVAGLLPESDDSRNAGHRGINSAVRQVRLDEVLAGHIDHKLELFVNTTKCAHVFPMTGDECGTTSTYAPPEGALLRIRPDVDLTKLGLSPAALTLARALQTYGAVVGDQSGGPATIGLEGTSAEGRGNLWSSLLTGDALHALPFNSSYWQVIKLGYGG